MKQNVNSFSHETVSIKIQNMKFIIPFPHETVSIKIQNMRFIVKNIKTSHRTKCGFIYPIGGFGINITNINFILRKIA